MKQRFVCLVVLMSALLTGCTAAIQERPVTVFYPDPPAPPRIQFLASFTGEKDIASDKSSFEKFVFGGKETRNRLDKPYGVAIHDGKIYVCDTNQTVMVFDFEQKTFGPLKGAQGAGKLVQPINISVDKEGTKFVSDPRRKQVVVFDKNDSYVTAFGAATDWKPVDAVPYEDRLYVVDMKNAEIVVMDKKSGDVLSRFGRQGEPSDLLFYPTNITIDNEGYLYVADTGRFQIVKFDRDGHKRGTIGQIGTAPSMFARPRGLASDREGRIYAVDAAFDNVQIFNKSGQLLLYFGKAGRGPGDMFLPAKVFIDYDNIRYFQKYAEPKFDIEYLVLVANQFGDRMVNVYGVGKERGRQYLTDEELQEQLKQRMEKEKAKEAPENSQGTDTDKK